MSKTQIVKAGRQRVVRPASIEIGHAYAEAADHLEACAAEEDSQSQKAAFNKLANRLYKLARKTYAK